MTMDLFLDSGAFTAWTRGEAITVDMFIDFCKKYGEYFTVIASLDVIGDAEATWTNYCRMYDEGVVSIIPTYHMGEPIEALERMLTGDSSRSGADYIALGGMAGAGTTISKKRKFLNRCFEVMCSTSGEALIKVHGFGVNSEELMFAYPWHSVDSTTWLSAARNGELILHDMGNIKRLNISGKYNPDRTSGAPHYLGLPIHDMMRINEYIYEREFTTRELATDNEARGRFNIKYGIEIEKIITDNPPRFTFEQTDLFSDNAERKSVITAHRGDPRPIRIYFAATDMRELWGEIASSPAQRRLYSYYYIKDDERFLEWLKENENEDSSNS